MKTLLLTLALTLAAATAWAQGTLKPFTGETPPLALADMAGDEHRLDDYRGRVLMVQFWATYCTPCRTEMPSMNALAEKLGDRFAILAVNMGEKPEAVAQFITEVGPKFTILMDPKGQAIRDWKVFAVPSTFILDPEGRIRYTLYGPAEWDTPEVVEQLEALAL
jgi:thiol-disulfide isomerase/thioredoxin